MIKTLLRNLVVYILTAVVIFVFLLPPVLAFLGLDVFPENFSAGIVGVLEFMLWAEIVLLGIVGIFFGAVVLVGCVQSYSKGRKLIELPKKKIREGGDGELSIAESEGGGLSVTGRRI